MPITDEQLEQEIARATAERDRLRGGLLAVQQGLIAAEGRLQGLIALQGIAAAATEPAAEGAP